MDALKEVGLFVVTGMIGLVAYFMRAMKEETDKKIATLFDMTNLNRDAVAAIRERLARLEK
jgi:hypothetical protein